MESNSSIQNNHEDTIRLLAKYGANLNVISSPLQISPIHVASQLQKPNMLRLLIQLGVNINVPDSDGDTPLFYAIKNNLVKNIELLLSSGADSNHLNSAKRNVLHICASQNLPNIMEKIFEITPEISTNVQDKLGNTPLHIAVIAKSTECGKILIEHQADPMIKNNAGKSAFSLATGDLIPIIRDAVRQNYENKRQQEQKELQNRIKKENENENDESKEQKQSKNKMENEEEEDSEEEDTLYQEEILNEEEQIENEVSIKPKAPRPDTLQIRQEYDQFKAEVCAELNDMKKTMQLQINQMYTVLDQIRKICVQKRREEQKQANNSKQ